MVIEGIFSGGINCFSDGENRDIFRWEKLFKDGEHSDIFSKEKHF